MASLFDDIARRKKLLVERCARDRDELASCFQQIRLPFNLGGILSTIGHVPMIGKALRAYPVATTAISSLLATGLAVKLARAAREAMGVVSAVRPLWSWWSKRRRRG